MAWTRSPERLGMGADIAAQRGPGTSIQGTSGMYTIPSPEAIQPSSLRQLVLVCVCTKNDTQRRWHA